MPSVSQAQHDMWVVKLHAKESTDKDRQVAKEFLDADKKAGLWQSKEHTNSHTEADDIVGKLKAIDWE